MSRISFCVAGSSSPVIPAKAGTQSAIYSRYEGLGPGLRWGDGDNAESNSIKNPSIDLPSQAKKPQTAIQMRGFNS